MTKKEQKEFISDCCKRLKKSIMEDFKQNKIPSSWDGFELRLLFSGKASEFVYLVSAKRKREFNNTVLVNNL